MVKSLRAKPGSGRTALNKHGHSETDPLLLRDYGGGIARCQNESIIFIAMGTRTQRKNIPGLSSKKGPRGGTRPRKPGKRVREKSIKRKMQTTRENSPNRLRRNGHGKFLPETVRRKKGGMSSAYPPSSSTEFSLGEDREVWDARVPEFIYRLGTKKCKKRRTNQICMPCECVRQGGRRIWGRGGRR